MAELFHTLTGGCLCGAVRYEARGLPFEETICHCETCRKASGAPFLAWITVLLKDFHFTQGAPAKFKSSAKGTRNFCPRCGTHLIFEHEDFADQIDITTASLDDPESYPPKSHSFTDSQLHWLMFADRLPRHPRDLPRETHG